MEIKKIYQLNTLSFLTGYFIFLLLVFFFAIDYKDLLDEDNWPIILFLVPFIIHIIVFNLVNKLNFVSGNKPKWIIFCNWISLIFLISISLISFGIKSSTGFDGLGAAFFIGFIILPLWVIFTLGSWFLSYRFYKNM